MATTYPPAGPTLTNDVLSISRFLNDPTSVARRLRTVLQQRYISDALLTQRIPVEGGAVLYETGESIFSGTDPEAVAPGSEYPLVGLSGGTAAVAKVDKWGQDTFVTDEAIKRLRMNPVERALLKLANQNVKTIDTATLAVIASAITATSSAGTAWASSTADAIITNVLTAKAAIEDAGEGFVADTVVAHTSRWASAMTQFIKAGILPREGDNNPALTGDFPVILGMRWLSSPNVSSSSVVTVLDSSALGGMADEELGGPGYVSAGGPGTAAVEVKSMREDKNDRWRLRARRVTVPVVLEPGAGYELTSA